MIRSGNGLSCSITSLKLSNVFYQFISILFDPVYGSGGLNKFSLTLSFIVLDQAVALARSKNLKIIPLCPFLKSAFDKDQSIHDVLKS